MRYLSTKGNSPSVSFKQAVIQGLPDDNGLFIPEIIPKLDQEFYKTIRSKSLLEIALEVIYPYVDEDIKKDALLDILRETLDFPIPIVKVESNIYSLELFHGPTCAFKDVGARFLARCMSHFSEEKVTVMVATSGDTGGAVASGFFQVPNVNVIILYPSGRVSNLQEMQLTTMGENISAVEVDGSFDDCQKLVKQAFLDQSLRQKVKITSANSINIARLLPQSIYYFWAYAQLPASSPQELYFSVPSGNYGNLTAGLIAQAMGLPVTGFVASSNRNDIVPHYLNTGDYTPKASIATVSNAMDVGNPSNFDRIAHIFKRDIDKMRALLSGYSFSDEATIDQVKNTLANSHYLLDPHGAVGLLGLNEKLRSQDATGIFLETAHPAKFGDALSKHGIDVELPDQLKVFQHKNKKSIKLACDYEKLKSMLIN